MGLKLAVPYPTDAPLSNLIPLLPESAGMVLDGGLTWSNTGQGYLVVTSRGLIACDPDSGELAGVPWRSFAVARHLVDLGSYATITLDVEGCGLIPFGIDHRLAANVLAISEQLQFLDPDENVEGLTVISIPDTPPATWFDPDSGDEPSFEEGDVDEADAAGAGPVDVDPWAFDAWDGDVPGVTPVVESDRPAAPSIGRVPPSILGPAPAPVPAPAPAPPAPPGPAWYAPPAPPAAVHPLHTEPRPWQTQEPGRDGRHRLAPHLLAAVIVAAALLVGAVVFWLLRTGDSPGVVTMAGAGTSRPTAVAGATPSVDDSLAGCHAAYSPCLPDLGSDALDCDDLAPALKPVTLIQPDVDPYQLDEVDRDGIGCEPT